MIQIIHNKYYRFLFKYIFVRLKRFVEFDAYYLHVRRIKVKTRLNCEERYFTMAVRLIKLKVKK